jgi:hypothetical protein
MNLPIVEGYVSTVGGVDTQAHTYNVPAGAVAGERLILAIANYDGGGSTSMNAPAGWTQTFVATSDANARLTIMERTSDGTETSVTVTSGRTSTISLGHCYRVSNWAAAQYGASGIQAGSASINFVTIPALTPSWAGDTLYIFFGGAGRDSTAFGTMPAGYTSQTGDSGNNAAGRGVGVGSGYKAAVSATESPGNLVGSTYLNMIGMVMAIQPAAAPSPTVTLTQTEITPNGTISGSYSNWGGTAPTKLEGIRGANSIGTDTGEITGFTVTGDGVSGTFTATIADLPATGSAQYLRLQAAGIVDVTWRLT